MYKIYINNTPVLLTSREKAVHLLPGDEENPVGLYIGKTKFLLNYVDMLEKTDRFQTVTIFAEDVEQLFADFKSLFEWVEAAGGVVFNVKGEVLLIFRRGSWDLPKGKIDPGESREAAAVREVQEETGLTKLERGALLHSTYHTYRDKNNKRVLKPTYWYKMWTEETELHPQAEENIEQAVWKDTETFLATQPVIYPNIVDVLRAAQED